MLKNSLWKIIGKEIGILKTVGIENQTYNLIKLWIYDSAYCQYAGSFYKQTFALPMGSPDSTVIANWL